VKEGDILRGYHGPVRKLGGTVDLTLTQLKTRMTEIEGVAGLIAKFIDFDQYYAGKAAQEVLTCIANGTCFTRRGQFRAIVERAIGCARHYQKSSLGSKLEERKTREIDFEIALVKRAMKHEMSISGTKRKEEEILLSSDDEDDDDNDDENADDISIVPGAKDLGDLKCAPASESDSDSKYVTIPSADEAKGKDKFISYLSKVEQDVIDDGGAEFLAETDGILTSQGTNAFYGVWDRRSLYEEDKYLRAKHELPTFRAGDNPLETQKKVEPLSTKKRRIVPETEAPAAAGVTSSEEPPTKKRRISPESSPSPAPAPAPAPSAPAPVSAPAPSPSLKSRIKAFTSLIDAESSESSGDSD